MAFGKCRRICDNEIGEIRMGRTRSASEGELNLYNPSPENPEQKKQALADLDKDLWILLKWILYSNVEDIELNLSVSV
jgi:hypothetical protein